MRREMKGIIGMVAGYAALIGIMYRTSKILKERAEHRSPIEKDRFAERDRLRKETEDIRWKEKEKMLRQLETVPAYKEAKDRVLELQKLAAESKSLNIKHDDLAFGISSGNESMMQQSIRREESVIRDIETTIRKSIEAKRSENERKIFEDYASISRTVDEILKRERAGLWKEVLFGWMR